jgi:hypothetical protein
MTDHVKAAPEAVTVYTFPNGFRTEASHMYGWLRHYQFTPSWVDNPKEICGTAIAIPASEVSQLQMLKKVNPSLWGSPLAE